MSQKPIPEFAETELWVVRSTLKERYGRDIELQFADTEVQTGATGMEWCPALFWSAKGANFAIIKTGAKRYRPVFYYHPETQLGTGTDAYDEIGDAVIDVLQVEADHVRKTKIKIDETPVKPADDAKDGGGRATQGAVADAASDKPDLSPLFWGD